MSSLAHVLYSRYLSELPIPGGFEALGGVQLDGGATDHLDAAFSVFYTQRSHTAVYLRTDLKTDGTYLHLRARIIEQLHSHCPDFRKTIQRYSHRFVQHVLVLLRLFITPGQLTPTGSFWLLGGFLGGGLRGVLPFLGKEMAHC